MARKIIDFHMHPWTLPEERICNFPEAVLAGDPIATLTEDMARIGIGRYCGSVINRSFKTPEEQIDAIRTSNEHAYRIYEALPENYIPGIHVHPAFVRESCEELEKYHRLGVRLVGELVPYCHGWGTVGYVTEGLDEILDLIANLSMVVSFHSMGARKDEYEMVKRHPRNVFVAAHPAEKDSYLRHMSWMEECPNYYLDLSGTGLFRYSMLTAGVNRVGAERFLFGTDYPVCSPAMNIAGVEYERISEADKDLIFFGNAERLLGL